jgi:hypothetical protein
MKRILFFVLPLFYMAHLTAQDLVIMQNGDSLKSRIIGIKKQHVHFIYENGESLKDTTIHLYYIKDHIYGYYTKEGIRLKKASSEMGKSRFNIAVYGGAGYRTAHVYDQLSEEYKEYLNRLRLGFQLGSEMTYFFSKTVGIGFRYNYCHASSHIDKISFNVPGYGIEDGTLKERVSVYFVGPSFNFRFPHKNDGWLVSSIAVGYTGYKDQASVISDFMLKGKTTGLLIDLGYETVLGPNSSLGFHASLFRATITSVKVTSENYSRIVKLEPELYEGLSRIDASVFLKFYL